MLIKNKKDIIYYQFNNLSDFRGITHFISTRQGGVSKGNFESLNMGFRTNDAHDNVIENRKRLAAAAGVPFESFVFANQVHGNHVETITSNDSGKGLYSIENDIKSTDALVTDEKSVCITVMNADCVPLLIYDHVRHIAGIIHTGWKGTTKKITALTVLKMIETYKSNPKDIYAGIGPSIGPCCYEVDTDVLNAMNQVFGSTVIYFRKIPDHGKWLFNLWAANKKQLTDSGIPEKNIEVSGICTRCHHNTFFSARYFKANSGRFAAGIMLL